jgi:hypothetical protein
LRIDGKQVDGDEKQIYGHVYFDDASNCGFGPFSPPTHARRKDVKVKCHDGKYDLCFRFYGNGYEVECFSGFSF